MKYLDPVIRHRGLLISAGVFLLFGMWAVYLSPWSAEAMEARLQAAADNALEEVGAQSWASVERRGQRAVLSGTAPSDEAQARAVRAVRQAHWAGGAIAGGVTRVVVETPEPAGEADQASSTAQEAS